MYDDSAYHFIIIIMEASILHKIIITCYFMHNFPLNYVLFLLLLLLLLLLLSLLLPLLLLLCNNIR